MKLFPAIDILDGQAVRLLRGDKDRVTVYGDPVVIAKDYERQGAEYLHLVDLDGAFSGGNKNSSVIKTVVSAVSIPVQIGGGIRDIETVEYYLETIGAARVILGTVLYTDPQILDSALSIFGPERIVCGLDALDGKLAIRGWVERVELSPAELGLSIKKKGVKTVVYTDISRDGALNGVNVDACAALTKLTGLHVIASGGVSSLDDLKKLSKAKVYGVILGKALYEKKFTVLEALECVGKKPKGEADC